MRKIAYSKQKGLLPYRKWLREAMLSVVQKSLRRLLSSEPHHVVYITFQTDYPCVKVPDFVLANYPDSIRIFFKAGTHQGITLSDEGILFVTGILFGDGVTASISIPLNSIVSYYDRESGVLIDVGVPPATSRGNVLPLREW